MRFCERNWLLCISPLQFLNYSLYWSPGTIQSLFSLEKVKQFILESGSVTDQGTNELSSLFYNPPHRGEYILSPDPSTFSNHLTTTMVYVPTYGAESSLHIDSCFSSSEKKQWTYWLPLGDNHSYKSWSRWPWSWKSPSIRYGSFKYLLTESFQHRSVEIPWERNFLVNYSNYSIRYKLSCRQEKITK